MKPMTDAQMDGASAPDDGIEAERNAIARMSRLSGMHWFAVLLSLMLTTGAWYFTSAQVQQQAETRFERYADQALELLQERLTTYEDALASGVAALQATGGNMSYEQWKSFTAKFRIETKYPGINGMGIIYRIPRDEQESFVARQRQGQPGFRIHPDHGGDILYPITYIEPAGENSAALGLDMAHETNRLTATLKARDTGEPQITGPIILVQDAQKTPGFLFFMPFFENDDFATLEARQENFVGMVYAPFVFQRLIKGTLERSNRLVEISIHDGDTALYSETDSMKAGYQPEFTRSQTVAMYGRSWTFQVWDTPEFQASSHSNEPVMILIGGLVIDGMLFSLFLMLAHSNKRALQFADRMTEEARARADALQQSNEDLERFAFVASHDLKTPLRGIGFLADCIRDDIEDAGESFKDTDLFENLSSLEEQVFRMESLITGILNYSSVQSSTLDPEPVDTARLIPTICTDSGLQPTQFKVTGDLVELTTDAVRLAQVLQNLIGNAVKYHPDPENLNVVVDIADKGDWLTFSVSDNGKGIDPRYHGKVFEIFQTLSENTASDNSGTGIGLAIVQKIVQTYGGEIRLDSQPGRGSTFSFDWPKKLDTPEPLQEAA